MIGFGFISNRLRKWCEFFNQLQSIVKLYQYTVIGKQIMETEQSYLVVICGCQIELYSFFFL